MERVAFITHKGKKILIEDLSNLQPGAEFNKTINKARKIISAEPENSVLAVFDATNCAFNSDMLELVKEFTKANTPYMKKAAVVGISGLLQMALSAVTKYSGREFITCRTREEALDCLVSLE